MKQALIVGLLIALFIFLLTLAAPTINKCSERGGFISKSWCYTPEGVVPIWNL